MFTYLDIIIITIIILVLVLGFVLYLGWRENEKQRKAYTGPFIRSPAVTPPGFRIPPKNPKKHKRKRK